MGNGPVLAGQRITTDVLNRIYGIADTTAHTVTATTFTDLSSVYQLGANDAQDGTAYRITAVGNGTWGSTQQALTVACALAGTAVGTTPAIASTALSASAAFDWEFCARLVCVGPGATATWMASVSGIVTQSANAIIPGTAADNSVPLAGCTHTAVTQDSTIADAFSIQAKWAATTGTPTLTCRYTLFERVN